MPLTSREAPAHLVHGVILNIDTVTREVTVAVNGTIMTFEVPLDCPILLNRERVKLRLLQPPDRVAVTCRDEAGRHLARMLVVQQELESPNHGD